MWVCAGTHTAGAGGRKGCSAKAHKLEHCSFTGQLSPEEPLLRPEECFGFPAASLGTGRSCYMWQLGGRGEREGRENMNHSQSSERSKSCAAAAVQASPTST